MAPKKKEEQAFKPLRSPSPLLIILVISLLLAIVIGLQNQGKSINATTEVPLTQIKSLYETNQLDRIEIDDNKVSAYSKDGKSYYSYKPTREEWNNLGFFNSANPTPIKTANEEAGRFWISLLANVIPFILVAGIIIFMIRQAQGGAQSALNFGQSKAKELEKNKSKTSFKDVAGFEEAKDELIEIVDFLKNPKKYHKLGAKIPKGVLLFGAPGTGKTLMARAIAGEADVPFYSISGSEFVEMFVGVGAARVRDLFRKAKKSAPAIIFIDEIDAVGRQRGTGLGGGHDEREQTLNQILTEMDGFEQDTNVIVVASTNRPDVLDPALLRPGRFDRRIMIDLPNIKEREAILIVHSEKKPLAKDADLARIAKITPGFSGADLENLLNEAAIFTAREERSEVTQKDLEHSIEKVLMGPEKKTRVLSPKEKEITAYHELGHAIVGTLLPNTDPVHKVSIISRGMALGVTWFLPEGDQKLESKAKLLDELASMMGGRVAEETFFGADNITTGASNDLEKATKTARAMVTQWGMSEKLGPIVYHEQHGNIFLGRELGERTYHSEVTSREIDIEVHDILVNAEKRAREIITEWKDKLHEVAKVLLKDEAITGEQFRELLGVEAKVYPLEA